MARHPVAMIAAAGGLLVACGGAPLTPPTPLPAQSAVAKPPPVEAPTPEAPAPAPTPPITGRAAFEPLLPILDDDRRHGSLWWIRPDELGTPSCQELEVVPYTTGVTGRLKPKGGGRSPRVSFGYRLDEAGLILDEPFAELSYTSGSLPACQLSLAEPSALHTSAAACGEALAAGAQPISLGACASRAAEMAAVFERDQPDRVEAVLKRQGTLHWLTYAEDGTAACAAWRVAGKQISTRRQITDFDERRVIVTTSYGFDHGGTVLTLLGPSSETRSLSGEPISSLAFGCGEQHFIDDRGDYILIGGRGRWYLDAEACQRAAASPDDELVAAIAAGSSGGC